MTTSETDGGKKVYTEIIKADLKMLKKSLTNLIEGEADAELMKARAMRARLAVSLLIRDIDATADRVTEESGRAGGCKDNIFGPCEHIETREPCVECMKLYMDNASDSGPRGGSAGPDVDVEGGA